jgi:hypothetical protein
MTEGQRLAQEAAEAAEIRDWQDHPDVVALRVEKVRTRIDRMMWAGIVIGLLFTMTSVQQFAAHAMRATPGSLTWLAAWLLDPTVAIILLGVLLAERQIAPARMLVGARAQVSKWGLLAATYVMNTWESYSAGNAAGIVLHSVPVLAVFAAAESVTDCQDKLTAYVQWAHTAAKERTEQRTATSTAVREDALKAELAKMDAAFDFEAGLNDVYARAGIDRPTPTPSAAPIPVVTATPPRPTAVSQPVRPARPTPPVPSKPPSRTTPVPVTDELLSRARAVRDRQLSQGKTAGHVVLRRELRVSERVAKELVRRLDEPPLRIVGRPS